MIDEFHDSSIRRPLDLNLHNNRTPHKKNRHLNRKSFGKKEVQNTYCPTSYLCNVTIIPTIKDILERILLQSPAILGKKCLMLPFRSWFRSIPGPLSTWIGWWPMGWPHHAECESCHDLNSSSRCQLELLKSQIYLYVHIIDVQKFLCFMWNKWTINYIQYSTPSDFLDVARTNTLEVLLLVLIICFHRVWLFRCLFLRKNGMGSWVITFLAQTGKRV